MTGAKGINDKTELKPTTEKGEGTNNGELKQFTSVKPAYLLRKKSHTAPNELKGQLSILYLVLYLDFYV